MARKDAKAQRNKRLSPEDAKPAHGRKRAKKKLFASLRLCAIKNKCLEEEKFTFPFVACLPQVGFA